MLTIPVEDNGMAFPSGDNIDHIESDYTQLLPCWTGVFTMTERYKVYQCIFRKIIH